MRPARIVYVTALVSSQAHADRKADAVTLHDQGIADLNAGYIAKACKELAASNQLYPDSGTKGALAECLTADGKLASAWQLWRDLSDTAPSADLKADAEARALALELRLSRYVVHLRPPGDHDGRCGRSRRRRDLRRFGAISLVDRE